MGLTLIGCLVHYKGIVAMCKSHFRCVIVAVPIDDCCSARSAEKGAVLGPVIVADRLQSFVLPRQQKEILSHWYNQPLETPLEMGDEGQLPLLLCFFFF
jgi:hypothetical protein